MDQVKPFHYECHEYGNIQNSVDYFLKCKVDKAQKILDIGTNIGSFPYELHTLGYERIFGIDIRTTAIEHGQSRYAPIRDNLSCYDGMNIPFGDKSFDVITMFDVIEHISKISEFLKEVNRVLAPNGRLVFQTPNIYINSVWSTIVWRSFAWREEHCSLQSLGSLNRLLANAGFQQIVIEKQSINTEFNRSEVRNQLGSIGPLLLKAADILPLVLFPNFYGSATK